MPQDRAPIPLKTIKLLFAQSGNRCAFPGCSEKLTYNDDTVLAEICHIQGYSPNSARYNPAMTDKERNSLQNLVLMCAKHHTIIDTHPEEYPKERLWQIKKDHEAAIAVEKSVTGTLTPHQIPPAPADFTGREGELTALLQAQQDGACISGLKGIGGIGKSALAFALAEKLAPHYPDGQIMVDMLGTSDKPLSPAEAMRQVIQTLLPQERLPENETELKKLTLSVLHGKKMLLLLDNARSRAQVEALIPPKTCFLLVTSRWHFSLPGLKSLDLEALSEEEAIALLLSIEPRLECPSPFQGEGTGVRVNAATSLAALCECLPLALRLSASALAEQPSCPVSEFLARFKEAQSRLKLTGMEASLQVSYDLLSEELQTRLRTLSVFPAPFDRPAAAAVWEVDEPGAQAALDSLVNASLLDYAETSGFRLHDLVRDFAAAKLSQEESYTASLRHASHYLEVARRANELYIRGGDHILEGLRLFDLHWPHIRQGQGWAAAQPETDQEAGRLCKEFPNTIYLIVTLRLHPKEWISWLQAALTATRQMGDMAYQGYHLGNLGYAFFSLGQVEKAIEHYQQALVITRQISDRRGEGTHLGNLGDAYANLGQVEKAIEHFQQALVIARETGDRRGEGNRLGNLGIAYFSLGQVEKAIEHYQQALIIARDIGDRRNEGACLGNLGNVYYSLGQGENAIDYHKQALTIDREIGDHRGEGQDLVNLGIAYKTLGQYDKAIDLYQQALVIARQTGDRRNEGITLGNLGSVYYSLGQIEKAIEHYKGAVVIDREVSYLRGEAIDIGNLAYLYENQGDLIRAVPLASASLTIRQEIKMPVHELAKMEILLTRLREKMGEAAFNAALAQPPEP